MTEQSENKELERKYISNKRYAMPRQYPTQITPNGIRFDFCDGARVYLPEHAKGWRVDFYDNKSGIKEFSCIPDGGVVATTKRKYLVNWQISVVDSSNHVIFQHNFNLIDKKILISMPSGALGDTIAWMAAVREFAKKHPKTEIHITLSEMYQELFKNPFDNVSFLTTEEADCGDYYAQFNIGMFYGEKTTEYSGDNYENQPADYRDVGLVGIAYGILGMIDDFSNEMLIPFPVRRERCELPTNKRYIVIATHTTCEAKHWLYPNGWEDIIESCKAKGYEVVCIDRDDGEGARSKEGFAAWHGIPRGAIDLTGNLPLAERAYVISHASCFIGLSSGLSWLAWACDAPVVMICGFTSPKNEFACYRVQNFAACHSCWNDARCKFVNSDYFYCPRWRGTIRMHECSRMITPRMVEDVIDTALAENEDNIIEMMRADEIKEQI